MPEEKSALEKTAQTLEQLNAVVGLINPLVPVVIGIAKIVVQLAHKQGVEVGTFEQEVVRLTATHDRISAADAQWRSEHPVAPTT